MVLNVRFAAINKDDFINGEGGSVSLWVQGCPHHCKGCHNPEQWNFTGGELKDNDSLIDEIATAIAANGIQRNFSVLGGEPFAPQNVSDTYQILKGIKEKFPTIKTYVWSGYTLEELQDMHDKRLFEYVDTLIDGRYIEEARDITHKLRGSRNQRILCKGTDF